MYFCLIACQPFNHILWLLLPAMRRPEHLADQTSRIFVSTATPIIRQLPFTATNGHCGFKPFRYFCPPSITSFLKVASLESDSFAITKLPLIASRPVSKRTKVPQECSSQLAPSLSHHQPAARTPPPECEHLIQAKGRYL